MHIGPGESAQLVIHQRRQLLDHGLVPAAPLSQHSGDLAGRRGIAHRSLPEMSRVYYSWTPKILVFLGVFASWWYLFSGADHEDTKTLEQNAEFDGGSHRRRRRGWMQHRISSLYARQTADQLLT